MSFFQVKKVSSEIPYWLKNQKIGFGGLAFGNLQYPPKGSWKRSPWAVWPRP
jgi:hypothetical protein